MKRLFSRAFLLKRGRFGFSLGAIVTSCIRLGGFLAGTPLAASLPATAQRVDGLWDASVAGERNEKIPQAVKLNAWPTTFFVGRDGLVREIHTVFTSRASGELGAQLVALEPTVPQNG